MTFEKSSGRGGQSGRSEMHPPSEPSFIPPHGGYRKLKSFQVAEVVCDVTVRFCERYVSRTSRTRDQMVQAALSGVQNIAEGSAASATSKQTEIHLTNVARASLEELLRDYEDFLRQRGLTRWEAQDPRANALVAARPQSADDVAGWWGSAHAAPEAFAACSANAALVLIRVAMALLARQMKTLEAEFLEEGGLRERMTRARLEVRARQSRDGRPWST